MATEHTAGPWHVTEHGVREQEFEIRTADDERHVAAIYGPTDKEDVANARLIAAAPELLAALDAIRARLAGEFDHPALSAVGPLATERGDVDYIASTAIAKARGGQS